MKYKLKGSVALVSKISQNQYASVEEITIEYSDTKADAECLKKLKNKLTNLNKIIFASDVNEEIKSLVFSYNFTCEYEEESLIDAREADGPFNSVVLNDIGRDDASQRSINSGVTSGENPEGVYGAEDEEDEEDEEDGDLYVGISPLQSPARSVTDANRSFYTSTPAAAQEADDYGHNVSQNQLRETIRGRLSARPPVPTVTPDVTGPVRMSASVNQDNDETPTPSMDNQVRPNTRLGSSSFFSHPKNETRTIEEVEECVSNEVMKTYKDMKQNYGELTTVPSFDSVSLYEGKDIIIEAASDNVKVGKALLNDKELDNQQKAKLILTSLGLPPKNSKQDLPKQLYFNHSSSSKHSALIVAINSELEQLKNNRSAAPAPAAGRKP